MLSGGMNLTETIDVPPEGFVRLAPMPRKASGRHLTHAGPGVVVGFSLVAVVTAGMAILQRLMAWAPWRVAIQAGAVLVIFGALGVWARLGRSSGSGVKRCSCERPPVWIRVVPSIAEPRSAPAQDQEHVKGARADAEEPLVGANRVTRS